MLLILKEMNQLEEVPQLAHRACSLYQQHGSPESGATVLDKGAKMLEATRPAEALELYKRAADVVMVIKKSFKVKNLNSFNGFTINKNIF